MLPAMMVAVLAAVCTADSRGALTVGTSPLIQYPVDRYTVLVDGLVVVNHTEFAWVDDDGPPIVCFSNQCTESLAKERLGVYTCCVRGNLGESIAFGEPLPGQLVDTSVWFGVPTLDDFLQTRVYDFTVSGTNHFLIV